MYIRKELSEIEEAKRIISEGGVVYTDDDDRGIGKSTAIVELSLLNEMPIIAFSKHARGLHKGINKDVGVVTIDEARNSGRGTKYLVDDMGYYTYLELCRDVDPSTVAGFVSSPD